MVEKINGQYWPDVFSRPAQELKAKMMFKSLDV